MRFLCISLLLSISLLSLLQPALSDLPIHCLRSQVIGEWTFQITRPQIFQNYLDTSCGHYAPDDAAVSYLALRDEFQPHMEFKFTLGEDYNVIGEGADQGSWTMMYDEGMDINVNNQQFLAFFEYYSEPNGKVMSYCGKTIVGWYHNLDSGEKACFRAEKILKDPSEKEGLYGVPLVQVNIVQPGSDFDEYLSSNLLQMREKAYSRKISHMRTSKARRSLDHNANVAEINSIEGKHWKAGVPENIQGMSMIQMNMMAGRRKNINGHLHGSRPSLKSENLKTVDVSDLPKAFSWKHILKPARSQGNCGSCYVLSTLQMIEARLKIKYDVDVELSAQHVLECSYMNQGCNGGYPYLVAKFASEFDLVPKSCSRSQKAQKGGCGSCDISKLDETYRVASYKFVGGAYGKTNEREMMLEVMNNGPITTSFEPSSEFMYYKEGIYHDLQDSWIEKKEKQPEWQRVDHSVLLYGWGETEDGVKYWEILNSWGPDWGEKGSFRITRGSDESAVESMAEAADPIIIRKNRDEIAS